MHEVTKALLESLPSAVVIAAIAVVAAQLLRAFYAAFHSQWPENYFGSHGGIDPVISRSLWRYLLFRIVPVAVAIVAAGTTAVRLGQPRLPTIALTTFVYLVQGPRKSLIEAIQRRPRRTGLVLYRSAALLGTVLTAASMALIADRADPFLPTGREFTTAIWTALIVLTLAHLARSLTGNATHVDPHKLVTRARAEVDASLLDRLRNDSGAHPAALEAIALAEQLNRPRWVRRIERAVLRGEGTFGLMQMTSNRPLTDAESVDRFLDWAKTLPESSRWPGEQAPRSLFLAHNDDAEFADLATQLYWVIAEEDDSEASSRTTPEAQPPPFLAAALGGAIAILLTLLAMRKARAQNQARPT